MRYSIWNTGLASSLLSLLLGLTAIPTAAQDAGAQPAAQALIEKFGLRESRQPVREMDNWKMPEKVVIWQNEDRLPGLRATYPSITFETVAGVASLATALKDADVFVGYCIPAGVNSSHKLQWLMSMSVGVEKCAASKELQRQKTVVTNVKKLSGRQTHATSVLSLGRKTNARHFSMRWHADDESEKLVSKSAGAA